MPTSSQILKYEKRDQVAWMTLNRPEAMNALNTEIGRDIGEAFQDAVNDDGVLVVVIIGEGGKAFSAGRDLKEISRLDAISGPNPSQYISFDEVADCPKPLIAAIDGYCLAGGLELALRCDIRVATEQSRFGLPEPRRSLLAAYGLHHLSRMIPMGEALWIQLTGSHMTAQRAYDVGLIQALVPDWEALLAEVERVASEIKLCAPLAVQAIKKIVKIGSNLPVEYSYKLAEPIREVIDKTEDRLEGPKAFAEKRSPIWKMR